MTRFLIYGLVDPRNGQLRYVGKSQSGHRRPKQHSMPTYLKKENTHKANWIKQLLSENLKPYIVTIQEFEDPDILAQAETHWIAYFKQMGCPLTNQCRGGEGFTGKHSEEWKMAASTRTKRWMAALSPEERVARGLKISATKKGVPVAPEQRIRMRKYDPETVAILYREHRSMPVVARLLGTRVSTVYTILKTHGLAGHGNWWASLSPNARLEHGRKISEAKRRAQ